MEHSTTSAVAQITLSPSGQQFDAIPGRSVLDAALSAGIALPFGCANGSCGTCCARLLNGRVCSIGHHDFSLPEAEKLRGGCLLCSVSAETDCLIEVSEATSVADVPVQQLSARLCRLEQIDNVNVVAFKFSRGRAMRFLPGQQVNVAFADGVNVDLHIASCPCNAQFLEFHLTPDDPESGQQHELVKRLASRSSRERVVITGPSGHFTLGTDPQAPKLFIALGGGFGQLQGLIEQVINLDLASSCALLWQSSREVGHYRHNLCRSWRDALDEFDYVPLEAPLVTIDHLPHAWFARLPQTEIYLCHRNDQLIRQLCEAGAHRSKICFPEIVATQTV